MKNTWRSYAKPIVQQVLKDNKGKPAKEIKAALRRAYPFGERKYYPYSVWLDEIKLQLGLKKKKNKRNPQDENQTALFI